MEEPWSEIDEKLGRKAIDKPGAWGVFTDDESNIRGRD